MAVTDISNSQTIEQIIQKTANQTSNRNTGQLGKQDFLTLLVTQLRYQDPLNPTDDKEFIGQMAQFSSLEQMQNMSSSMTQSQGFSLIGKHVEGTLTDEETNKTSGISGTVTSVKVKEGKTYVVVKGKDVPIENITSVSDARGSADTSISTYTNLIGYSAKGAVYDPTTGDIIDVSGDVKSIEKGAYEDYAVMDNVKVKVSGYIDGDDITTGRERIKAYLEAAKNGTDKEVTLIIKDADTGTEVPVKAKLRSYSVNEDGSIGDVVLDDVYVPVESIYSVSPKATTTGTSGTGTSGTGTSGTGTSGTGSSGTGTSGTGTSCTGTSGTGT